jgi:NAD(P)-dependent dehydrogenase (short-subunit alcohol dehydrogenase family)
MNLQGKRVVLVGGTSGIGLAAAEHAATAGAHVILASSSQSKVDNAVERLRPGATGLRVDVTDEASVRALFDQVGEFDHLVYTAGDALVHGPIAGLTLAEAKAFSDVRYWGALLAAKHGAPRIRPGGSIVFSSGAYSTRPTSGGSLVASVTAANEALARALAVELAPIRVNAVCPGYTETTMWSTSGVSDLEDFYAKAAAPLLVPRIGKAAEIAAAYVFLLENDYVTGTTLTVDGGEVLV